jgi:hypothetical protein
VTALAVGLLLGQLSLIPSGYSGVLSLNDRAEVRVRTGAPTGALPNQTGPALDLEDAVGAFLGLSGRRSSYQLSYSPRIAWFDVTRNGDVTLFHTGRIGGNWAFKRLSLSLALEGAIGTQSTSGLSIPITGVDPRAPAPPAPTVPVNPTVSYYLPPGTLYIGSGRAIAGASYTFSRRLVGNAGISGGASGGLDYRSQQVAPPNRNAAANVSAGYGLSATDSIFTAMSGGYTYVFDTPLPEGSDPPVRPGGKFVNLTLLQGYSKSFNARTQGSASVGVSYLHTRGGTGDDSNVFAVGNLNLTYARPFSGGSLVTFSGFGGVGSNYNPAVGAVQHQVSALGAVGWLRARWTASASVGTAASIPFSDPNSTRTLSGALTLGYLAGEAVQFQGGVRVATQVLPATVATDTPAQWVGFLAILLSAPPIVL